MTSRLLPFFFYLFSRSLPSNPSSPCKPQLNRISIADHYQQQTVMKNSSLLQSYMNDARESDSARDFIVRKWKLIKLEEFFIISQSLLSLPPSLLFLYFYCFFIISSLGLKAHHALEVVAIIISHFSFDSQFHFPPFSLLAFKMKLI